MTESSKEGHWPHALMQKDLNLILRLCFNTEMEKRYGQKIQKLCQTSSFGMACSSKGNVDQELLELMIISAKKKFYC